MLSRINAVRILIVLIIALGYASTMPLGPGQTEVFNLYGYDPSWIGIQLLFFISGILALRSVQAGKTGFKYLASRFYRNIPLLAFLTIATLIILFPLFGTPLDGGIELWARLAKYVALTVFCLDPGIPLQGLMDDAKYMCLVQGGIWTLRYGLILHLITAITGRLGLLSNRQLLFAITVFTIITYIGATFFAVKNDLASLAAPLAGLRLAYAFLCGMSAWAYRDVIMGMKSAKWLFPTLAFTFSTLKYLYGPWSPMIEVSLAIFWGSLAWLALTSSLPIMRVFKNWPNLVLSMMLINWPVSQTLLLVNPELSPWELIGMSLPLSLILSYSVYYSFSKTRHFFPRFTRKISTTS